MCALKNVGEKYLEKSVAFMDMEKEYGRVDREALGEMLQIYDVVGNLVEAARSFYQESEACLQVGRNEGELFQVKVGLQ